MFENTAVIGDAVTSRGRRPLQRLVGTQSTYAGLTITTEKQKVAKADGPKYHLHHTIIQIRRQTRNNTIEANQNEDNREKRG